ncbi:MAG: hypothetical protein ABWY62_01210 [Acidimicrobiia bacterium]
MANLQIKGLPDDVHEELRRRARMEGLTVRTYVQRLIEADQELPPRAEWFARVGSRRPIDIGGPVADLVNADRVERTGSPPHPP